MTADPDRSRTIAVINGKGGVLKTSIVANVAGYLARSMRVLALDLDIQGNLRLDLGLAESDADDGGKGVVDAVWSGHELPIVADVRPGLDFVFGGRGLDVLSQLARSPLASDLPHGSVAAEFAARLDEVADRYDLVFIDCPPGNTDLQDIALTSAGWVLIPTRTDQASLDGLMSVAPRVTQAQRVNPSLRYLGVAITAHNPSASRVLRTTQQRLAEVGDLVPLFDTVIRYSEAAAQDCRDRGQLAFELAADASVVQQERLKALSTRGRSTVVPLPGALSGSARGLAQDYAELAQEICTRIATEEARA